MFDRYLIEIDDVEAGILVLEGESYAFHALAGRFRAFEGARFSDPWSAERALRRQAQRPGRPDDRRGGPGLSGRSPARDRSAS
jgi:hypothetical protein